MMATFNQQQLEELKQRGVDVLSRDIMKVGLPGLIKDPDDPEDPAWLNFVNILRLYDGSDAIQISYASEFSKEVKKTLEGRTFAQVRTAKDFLEVQRLIEKHDSEQRPPELICACLWYDSPQQIGDLEYMTRVVLAFEQVLGLEQRAFDFAKKHELDISQRVKLISKDNKEWPGYPRACRAAVEYFLITK